MKTLIFNGSPRPKGDTACLVERLRQALPGEVKEIRAYQAQVKPCVDCRWCWTHDGCCIPDAMQQIYEDIREADWIVIASPVYFSGLTGVLMAMMSRLQAFYTARRFRQSEPVQKPKQGAILLVGGGEGSPKYAESAARMLLRGMQVQGDIPVLMSLDTDHRPARNDAEVCAAVDALAAQMKKAECTKSFSFFD
ncbi:MAG: flavodoxin family protein [Clostridia bacterium]|nr:flavodoxin family protein [Clostridia bacterium]